MNDKQTLNFQIATYSRDYLRIKNLNINMNITIAGSNVYIYRIDNNKLIRKYTFTNLPKKYKQVIDSILPAAIILGFIYHPNDSPNKLININKNLCGNFIHSISALNYCNYDYDYYRDYRLKEMEQYKRYIYNIHNIAIESNFNFLICYSVENNIPVIVNNKYIKVKQISYKEMIRNVI